MAPEAITAIISASGTLLVAITALLLNYRGFASIDSRFASLENRITGLENRLHSDIQ